MEKTLLLEKVKSIMVESATLYGELIKESLGKKTSTPPIMSEFPTLGSEAEKYEWAIQKQKFKDLHPHINVVSNIDKLIKSQAEERHEESEIAVKEKEMYIPKGCSLFQRKNNGRWEARIMVDGKQKFVACCKSKVEAWKALTKANKDKKKTKAVKDKEYTLFSWLDHWHKVFRMPKLGVKLSKNTILADLSIIRKIKKVFKNMKLKDLTADYIQEKLYSMKQGRTCEGVYTILKLALSKAKGRMPVDVMSLVEKVKHERVRGRALSKDEVDKILEAAENDYQRDIINTYIYTGCRVDELTRIFVKHVNLTQNEIFIDGTKTKGSKRTMPIVPPLRPILEKLTANRDGEENLFNRTVVQIRYFYNKIKDKTGIKFTLKDFRHTCATNFKDAGIPSSVYFRWFGWSDDTMAKKVYTHETEYEMKISQDWAKKFDF